MRILYKTAPLCALGLLMFGQRAAWADAPAVACSSDSLTVAKDGTSKQGALKQTITVLVKGLSECLKKRGSPAPKFTLYLDGKLLKGLGVSLYGVGRDDIGFSLDLTPDNKDSWAGLLRNPVFQPSRVALSVAIDGGSPVASEVDDFALETINGPRFTAWAIGFVFLLVLFVWAARASDIVREGGPQPVNGRRKAYSLARCQMAFWFFLIAMAFCLIFLITWDVDSISQGVLGLMGISAGTGLAGAIVDTSKNGDAASQKKNLLTQQASLVAGAQTQEKSDDINAKLAQVNAQLETSPTDGLINDLLSDATGISFHRFQMVAWTIILGIVFIARVKSDLVMPEFSATLLGLMGISAGTYIGFKFPEQKNPVPEA
jgi:hypothetical protein